LEVFTRLGGSIMKGLIVILILLAGLSALGDQFPRGDFSVLNHKDLFEVPIPEGLIVDDPNPIPPKAAYTIQISAFLTQAEAQGKIDALKNTDLKDLRVFTATVNGKLYYRVCTGTFNTWREASAARNKIAEKMGTKDIFVETIPSQVTASN
jgi:sporulation related protein